MNGQRMISQALSKEDILSIFDNPAVLEPYLEKEAITRSYEKNFEQLVALLPLEPNQRILDVGTSHGPPSLALLRREPTLQIVAMDPAKNVLEISRAKFHGEHIDELIAKYAHNMAVAAYLADQYHECIAFKNNITYVQAFAEDVSASVHGHFDHVLASLALHWLIDPEKAFSRFHEVLNLRGTVAITSASWKYKLSDPQLQHEYRFDNAPFVKQFYDNLDVLLGFQRTVSVAEQPDYWDADKVLALLAQTGFELVAYKENRKPVSFGGMILSCKTGAFYRSTSRLKAIDYDQFSEMFREALLKTLREVNPLESVTQYGEMSPYILARKVD
ncbi:class I SAM-dependent methyltransferase [Candidatus Woesearchaeota archaeon]|nr:MAG: class I SAM-dependent methyltransferase [Candidatus Woesearchaeota archaeon]